MAFVKDSKIYEKKPVDFVNKTKTTYHHLATTVLRLHDHHVSRVKIASCAVETLHVFKMAHNRFLARTVMVGEGGLTQALRALQGVLKEEKVMKDVQFKRFYEKPTTKRRRLKYESSLKLYNSEMKKKVDFIMSKQRKMTPWT